MKAISLWQPWASAMALGSKRIETRSWATSYRGPLAIHAAKRRVVSELLHYGSFWHWCGALGIAMGEAGHLPETLPFGAVVAVGELVACKPTAEFTVGELDSPRTPLFPNRPGIAMTLYRWSERQMGDFSPGRFGWVFTDLRPVGPIPFRGAQGLFEVPDALLSKGGASARCPMSRELLDIWRGYYPHLRLATDEQVNQYRADIEASRKP